jgi:squalene-hopene/tetraprenyl-beta-curcumene cyclase
MLAWKDALVFAVLKKSFPQGLKPHSFFRAHGTSEAVPFQNADFSWDFCWEKLHMRRRMLQLCVPAILLAGVVARAQDFAANWQGTFHAGDENRRIVLQIAKGDKGDWKATSCSIDFMRDEVKVDSLDVHGASVQFKVNGGKGAFAGTISADGRSISGEWTWFEQTAPLELRRATKETAWATPFFYQYHMKNVTYLRPSPQEAKIPFSPRLAVDYMEQGAAAWTGEWKCVACHTNGSYMVVRPLMTEQLGPPQKELRAFFVSTLQEELATDPADMRPELDSTHAVYVAAGLAIWDAHVTHRLSPETTEALSMMFKLQRADGDWTISDDNNPPLESNRFQLATVAARAVGNAPGWLAQQRGTALEAKINLLESYLRAERKVQGDYDRTDLLWAATELPGLLDAKRMQELVAMIWAHQRADGGWSIRTFAQPEEWGKGNRAAKLRAEPELADPPSDGHMTGLAIIALREAGVPASDARIERGIAWLEKNQRSSGRWWTRSLNRDGWQFISYSGTAYPLLALSLCDALPASAMANGMAAGSR